METIKKNLEEKSKKSIAILKEDLNTVRAGRANPALLDKVTVEYYGTATPLKNIANISVPDPRTLLISPFDPKSVGEIEKAINMANIGINPSNDGKCVRLVIPQAVSYTHLILSIGPCARESLCSLSIGTICSGMTDIAIG